jgi:hypothetical protein
MAYFAIASFDTGDVTSESASTAGTVSYNTTNERTGAGCLRVNPTTTGTGRWRPFGTPSADGTSNGGTFAPGAILGMGFYFRVDTLPASNSEEIAVIVDASNNERFQLRVNSSGNLLLYYNETNLLATGTTVLSTGTYYRIFFFINNTANTQGVILNGTTELSGSQTIANNPTTPTLGKQNNRNGQSVDYYYDDFILTDSATEPNAGWRCRLSVPIGAGTYSGWTNGTGTTYAEVDETPTDGDTTYIQASATQDNQSSSFDMTAWATAGFTASVQAIFSLVYARTTSTSGSSNVRQLTRVDGADSTTSARELLTTYLWLAQFISATYTETQYNNHQVGMQAATIGQVQRFSAAYLIGVEHVSDSTAHSAAANLVGSGDITASGTVTVASTAHSAAAALAGAGDITASGVRGTLGVAALAGAGDITADGVSGLLGVAALAGSGDITADADLGHNAAVALAGAGAISAAGTVQANHSAAAALAGSGDITAVGSAGLLAASALAGSGAIVSAGTRGTVATAALAGSATLVADAELGLLGVAALAGAGLITADAEVGRQGASALAGVGAISATGTVTSAVTAHSAAASLSGSGTIAAAATRGAFAASALAGSGSVVADGERGTLAAASLAGAGSVIADGERGTLASAALTGAGAISAAGTVTSVAGTNHSAAVSLAGSGSLTATATHEVISITVAAPQGGGPGLRAQQTLRHVRVGNATVALRVEVNAPRVTAPTREAPLFQPHTFEPMEAPPLPQRRAVVAHHASAVEVALGIIAEVSRPRVEFTEDELVAELLVANGIL